MTESARGITKLDAMEGLERQIESGRKLLARPIDSFDDLARASCDRATWTLQNRNMFHHLFSDASALTRSRTGELPPLSSRPSLDEGIHEFQTAVSDQLARLTKVVGFLKRLA